MSDTNTTPQQNRLADSRSISSMLVSVNANQGRSGSPNRNGSSSTMNGNTMLMNQNTSPRPQNGNQRQVTIEIPQSSTGTHRSTADDNVALATANQQPSQQQQTQEENSRTYTLEDASDEELIEWNKKEVKRNLNELLVLMGGVWVAALAGYLFLTRYLPYYCILVAFGIHDCVQIGLNWHYLRIFKTTRERWRLHLSSFESYLLILYKVLLAVYIEYPHFHISLTALPLVVYTLFRGIYYFTFRSRLECIVINDFLAIMLRGFVVTQIVLVKLKVDGILSWDWRELFWLYWVVFSILLGLCFGLFLLMLSRLCIYFFGEGTQDELKGLFWIWLSIGSFTLTSCVFILSLVEVFKTQIDIFASAHMSRSVMLLALLAFLCLCLGLLFYQSNLYVFERIALNEDEADEFFDRDIDHMTERDRISFHEASKQKKPLQFKRSAIPYYLQKLSSTYFKKLIGNFTAKKSEAAQQQAKAKAKPNGMNGIKNSYKKRRRNSDPNSRSSIGRDEYMINTMETVAENPLLRSGAQMTIMNDHLHDVFENTSNKWKAMFTGEQQQQAESPTNLNRSSTRSRQKDYDKFKDAQLVALSGRNKETKSVAQFMPPGMYGLGVPSQEPARKLKRRHSMSVIYEESKMNESVMNTSNVHGNNVMVNHHEISKGMEKSVNQCIVCFDKPPDSVLMECGHGGLCYECALDVWQRTGECYLCREKIVSVLQMDLQYSKRQEVIKVISCTEPCEDESSQMDDFHHKFRY